MFQYEMSMRCGSTTSSNVLQDMICSRFRKVDNCFTADNWLVPNVIVDLFILVLNFHTFKISRNNNSVVRFSVAWLNPRHSCMSELVPGRSSKLRGCVGFSRCLNKQYVYHSLQSSILGFRTNTLHCHAIQFISWYIRWWW